MTPAIVAKKFLPVVLGAALGYVYWYFLGCVNGCMITGHWYTSTGYGALVGAAWLLPARTATKGVPPRDPGAGGAGETTHSDPEYR